MIKEKLANLIDLKSIITLTLIITLEILVIKGIDLKEDLFLLFSNITTMVMTYFFTKKKEEKEVEYVDNKIEEDLLPETSNEIEGE